MVEYEARLPECHFWLQWLNLGQVSKSLKASGSSSVNEVN